MVAASDLIDVMARETMLFAATGLLIGGIDDLIVDLCFIVHKLLQRNGHSRHFAMPAVTTAPGRLAVFVAAWDEVAVIGGMLATAVDRFDHPDYRIYVGLYPNDPATIDAAARIAAKDARIRLVIGERDGPTTKADCLNTLWLALCRDCDETINPVTQSCGIRRDLVGCIGPVFAVLPDLWVSQGDRCIFGADVTVGAGRGAELVALPPCNAVSSGLMSQFRRTGSPILPAVFCIRRYAQAAMPWAARRVRNASAAARLQTPLPAPLVRSSRSASPSSTPSNEGWRSGRSPSTPCHATN